VCHGGKETLADFHYCLIHGFSDFVRRMAGQILAYRISEEAAPRPACRPGKDVLLV
jgi:hypothetical protein